MPVGPADISILHFLIPNNLSVCIVLLYLLFPYRNKSQVEISHAHCANAHRPSALTTDPGIDALLQLGYLPTIPFLRVRRRGNALGNLSNTDWMYCGGEASHFDVTPPAANNTTQPHAERGGAL